MGKNGNSYGTYREYEGFYLTKEESMLSDNEIDKIEDMRDRGLSVSQISKKMAVDRKTVLKYLNGEGEDEIEPSSNEHLDDTNPPHRRREIKGRGRIGEATPKSPLVESLRAELEGAKVEFEIEKLEEAKGKWEERRDRERREKLEEERSQRLDETALRMSEERN
jgi:hypothetical protein